jgi:hypothetical protein
MPEPRHPDDHRDDQRLGQGDGGRPPKTQTIRIDGQRFTTDEEQLTAAELLRLAGLDPERYDLAAIEHGKTTRYEDEDRITLHDGDKFVSIRQEASVA